MSEFKHLSIFYLLLLSRRADSDAGVRVRRRSHGGLLLRRRRLRSVRSRPLQRRRARRRVGDAQDAQPAALLRLASAADLRQLEGTPHYFTLFVHSVQQFVK